MTKPTLQPDNAPSQHLHHRPIHPHHYPRQHAPSPRGRSLSQKVSSTRSGVQHAEMALSEITRINAPLGVGSSRSANCSASDLGAIFV